MINRISYIPKSKIIKAEEDLTITIENPLNKFGTKKFKPEIIKLYSYIGEMFIFPRNWNYKNFLLEPEILPIKFALSKKKDIKCEIDFISNNQAIVYKYLREKYAVPFCCNLIMDTGQGKTYMALKLSAYIGRTTLIICPTREIAYTWYGLEKLFNITFGFIGDGKNIEGDITIAIIHSIVKKPKEFFKKYEFTIYDEITEYLSEKRRIIFQLASTPFILGLTATPDCSRARIFELYCGARIYARELAGYNSAEIPWRINVFAVKYKGAPEYTRQIKSVLGYTSAVEMDKQFMEDPERMALIIKYIKYLRERGKNIYVFVNICEYAQIIYNDPAIADESRCLFMGKYKEGDTINATIIFTTYSFCSKGISIPKMDAIILAQPRMAGTRQTIGRILRAGGVWTDERYIVDIIDINTSLKSQYYERKKTYKAVGAIFTECIM